MNLTFHWFLPTSGDGRAIIGRGHSVPLGSDGHPVPHAADGAAATAIRPPDIDYLAQVAQAAEHNGFEGVLTPTGSHCEDAWLTTAALIRETQRLKFLVAFQPGVTSPTLSAQMAATYQRISRLHVITRDTAREAWAEADKLLSYLDPAEIGHAQQVLAGSESVGQQRIRALHQNYRENNYASDLEIYPNLWAGVGLVRGGAGTALVGSHAEVADRIEEYAALGISEFIFSGYPHLEEASWFGEGVRPELRRGACSRPPPPRPPGSPAPEPACVAAGGSAGLGDLAEAARAVGVVGRPAGDKQHLAGLPGQGGDLADPREQGIERGPQCLGLLLDLRPHPGHRRRGVTLHRFPFAYGGKPARRLPRWPGCEGFRRARSGRPAHPG